MRFTSLILILSLSLLASCTSANRKLNQTAMRKDVNRLVRAILHTHPAIGRTISDSSLNLLKNVIIQDLPRQATVLEYANLIHPLIDTVQGGHISLYPKGALWRSFFQSTRHSLPLSLKQLDNGQIVIKSMTAGQDSTLLGAQVIEINGIPIDKLITEATLFSGGSDGINRSGERNRAIQKLPQHLRWRFGKQDDFDVLVRKNEKETTVVIKSPAASDFDRAVYKADKRSPKKQRKKTINYGYDESRNIAIIDLNSFSGYDPYNIIFPMALKGVLAKAAKDSAHTIILDLRGNGGGRSANIIRLLRYFVQDEIEVYHPWTFPKTGLRHASLFNKLIFSPSALFGKGEQKRFGRMMRHRVKSRRNGFEGKLLVLIDSGTFSAASISASILKSNERALLMGQEAGGNYHETYAGLFSMIPLRRTGIVVRMPHLLIPIAVDESKQPFGKTLQPDIEVPITIEDILDPRDRLLLRALEFSNN